jgi:hypothetical protein
VSKTAGTVVKAYKFSSPVKPDKQLDEDKRKVMNHDHLNARSEVFVDDTLQSIEKRCFFLMCGKQTNIGTTGAITVDAVVNAFDDPALKKKITLAVAQDQIIIEYNSELLKSFTELALEYRIAFNYSDLVKAPGGKKLSIERKTQL